MVKHYYCHPNENPECFPPCGGPSRAFSGPAPLDTLDERDNLHLSSWLSGLYCFRRSAAFTSSSFALPGKPIFDSAFRSVCFVLGGLYVSGICKVNEVKVLTLMKGRIKKKMHLTMTFTQLTTLSQVLTKPLKQNSLEPWGVVLSAKWLHQHANVLTITVPACWRLKGVHSLSLTC